MLDAVGGRGKARQVTEYLVLQNKTSTTSALHALHVGITRYRCAPGNVTTHDIPCASGQNAVGACAECVLDQRQRPGREHVLVRILLGLT